MIIANENSLEAGTEQLTINITEDVSIAQAYNDSNIVSPTEEEQQATNVESCCAEPIKGLKEFIEDTLTMSVDEKHPQDMLSTSNLSVKTEDESSPLNQLLYLLTLFKDRLLEQKASLQEQKATLVDVQSRLLKIQNKVQTKLLRS
ncbi:hypothetical protein ACFFGT_13150 [Mucilaginibacter angelicae]|uniref:Uncharacterized protein n=1 Tax=Mucilaginibacter angelicae TaxID=869718 RepID=A0ABV6L6S3_9SPHI